MMGTVNFSTIAQTSDQLALTTIKENKQVINPVLELSQKILMTPGFIKDDDNHYQNTWYRGEVQGSKQLRELAASKALHLPQAFAPLSLKQAKQANLEQYLILQIKRLGHVLGMAKNLTIKLPFSTAKVGFEGFSEAFTIPMILASLESFLEEKSILKSSSHWKWVIQELKQTLMCDTVTEQQIKEVVNIIHQEDFTGPICLGTGHDWHASFMILLGDFLIDCNRGSGNDNQPGIVIYSINRQILTEEKLARLVKRQDQTDATWMKRSCFSVEFDAESVCYFPMSEQKGGTCSYDSIQAGVYALLSVTYVLNLIKNKKKSLSFVSATLWNNAFDTMYLTYKDWSQFDCKMVLKEFITEVDEVIKDKEHADENKDLLRFYSDVIDGIQSQILTKKKVSFLEQNKLLILQIKLKEAINSLKG